MLVQPGLLWHPRLIADPAKGDAWNGQGLASCCVRSVTSELGSLTLGEEVVGMGISSPLSQPQGGKCSVLLPKKGERETRADLKEVKASWEQLEAPKL